MIKFVFFDRLIGLRVVDGKDKAEFNPKNYDFEISEAEYNSNVEVFVSSIQTLQFN